MILLGYQSDSYSSLIWVLSIKKNPVREPLCLGLVFTMLMLKIQSFPVSIDGDHVNFTSFMASAERWCDNDDEDECGDPVSPDRSGSLQVIPIPDVDITFHPECINTLVGSAPVEKNKRSKVEFVWMAPKLGSGCVYLR